MNRDWVLWAAIFAGPLIWFVSFGANFALAPWACTLQWKPALYVISLVALIIAGGATLTAYREWQQLGRELPGEAAGAIPRSRMLAISGILASGISFLLILAQGIVEVVLGACQ